MRFNSFAFYYVHSHHLVPLPAVCLPDRQSRQIFFQTYRVYSGRSPAHRPYVFLRKPDGLPFFGDENKLILAGGKTSPFQSVSVFKCDGNKPGAADIFKRWGLYFFDDAVPGYHHNIAGLLRPGFTFIFFYSQNGSNIFLLTQGKEVKNGFSFGYARTFRNFISPHLVYFPGVGEEEKIRMGVAGKKVFHHVFFLGFHADEPLASPLLHPVGLGL